jgi:hypothetical protein
MHQKIKCQIGNQLPFGQDEKSPHEAAKQGPVLFQQEWFWTNMAVWVRLGQEVTMAPSCQETQ